jgi:hypothetical protein
MGDAAAAPATPVLTGRDVAPVERASEFKLLSDRNMTVAI